jgi:hypothetical protein
MLVVFFYVILISLAICGGIVIGCFIAAIWIAAVIIDAFVLLFRLATGQRGEQLWRNPFSRRITATTERAAKTTQAAYSNRR